MRISLIVMPGSPSLVPELGTGDASAKKIVEAVRALISDDGDRRPIDLVGSRDATWYTAHTGSFRAWGAPSVQVGAGNYLPELVQRYVLGDHTSRVRETRSAVGAPDSAALTVVALDGSTGLTDKAPSAFLPTSARVEEWCAGVLRGVDTLPTPTTQELIAGGVRDPQGWLDLAELAPDHAELVLADTSFGVARYVAAWGWEG